MHDIFLLSQWYCCTYSSLCISVFFAHSWYFVSWLNYHCPFFWNLETSFLTSFKLISQVFLAVRYIVFLWMLSLIQEPERRPLSVCSRFQYGLEDEESHAHIGALNNCMYAGEKFGWCRAYSLSLSMPNWNCCLGLRQIRVDGKFSWLVV